MFKLSKVKYYRIHPIMKLFLLKMSKTDPLDKKNKYEWLKDRYYDLLTKAIVASFCVGAMAGFGLIWFIILIGD